MITVVYHRSYNRVTVSGHAHSDEKGRDLVCAAVSALAYTLAANVDSLVSQGNAREPVIELREGWAQIQCNPKHNMKAVATLVFDTVCTGFEVLAMRYPEYVCFQPRV